MEKDYNAVRCANKGGDILFPQKENIPPYTPQEKGL